MIAKTMVFRPGNSIVIWGINLDIAEVDEHEVPDYLADGWYSHPFEARDAAETETETEEDADAALAVKSALAEEAIGLGIKVDGRWSPERLQKEIEAKKAQ